METSLIIVIVLIIVAAGAWYYFKYMKSAASKYTYSQVTGTTLWPSDAYSCAGSAFRKYCVLPSKDAAEEACAGDEKCVGYVLSGKDDPTIAPGSAQLTRVEPTSNTASVGTEYWKRK